MNPCLPKGSFYPFRTIIRPLPPPSWCETGGWSVASERVLEFLQRLLDEPLTYGISDVSPWRLLNVANAEATADFCRRVRNSSDAGEAEPALTVMPAIAAIRPYRSGRSASDPLINLRAVLYAGALVARECHAERCRLCPESGKHCGGGAYCGRYAVERFFAVRPALRDPVKADIQLRDMAAWSRDDFRRLTLATTLSEASCRRFARSRAVPG
jgi:hypothetical protein